ncbi:MAG: deoxyribonuclease IV [Armatimonadetes bacterium]|nr:deoxyribonuclease IV [Armatimonadota bacterium]
MRLGIHVRIAGGLVKSLKRAEALGCEAIQLFSGNPNSWTRRPVDVAAAADFTAKAAELNIHPIILHTPYLLNLASPDDTIWNKSVDALYDAVERAPVMGADYIVTHIGSHKGSGYEAGIRRIAKAVRQALEAAPQPTIALEMGSGAGDTIGFRFEHIADIIHEIGEPSDRVGLCIDTAHLWGAGYDISDKTGVGDMFDLLKRHVGLSRLKVIHFNDTEVELDSRRDRHFHIGKGNVGIRGFRAILNCPDISHLPAIIETPAGQTLEEDHKNLATLRSLYE